MGIEAQSDDYAMDDNSGYSHSFKRRRFGSSEHIETNQSSNMLSTTSFVSKPFGNGNVLNSMRNSGKILLSLLNFIFILTREKEFDANLCPLFVYISTDYLFSLFYYRSVIFKTSAIRRNPCEVMFWETIFVLSLCYHLQAHTFSNLSRSSVQMFMILITVKMV